MDYNKLAGSTAAERIPAPREVVERQGQVAEQLGVTQGRIGELHDAIQMLENRLTAVLRASVPKTSDASKKIAEVLVPLAEALNGNKEAITDATKRIHDIIDRLEV